MSKQKMKNILGVVGSPRKRGNTHILVSKILEGARDQGAKTSLLFLGDHKILECDGCHVCWKGKPCCKKDDMNGIYPKIIESHAIVFGTPVYWYAPTALMKGFIDRFVYFNCPGNRAKIRDKTAVIAVPFEERRYETADMVVKFFEKSLAYLEMNIAGMVLVPGVTKRGEVRNKAARMKECYTTGRRLARMK